MASPLERLPVELLDQILGLLQYAELAHLLQCSRYLLTHIEPLLYGSPAALAQAMSYACKTGNLHTIRVAVIYGADVNSFRVPASWSRQYPNGIQVSTLYLAARKQQPDAFALLLELGARPAGMIECLGVKQFKHLLLSLSLNRALLDLFLKVGLGSLIRERPDFGISLVSVILSGGSLDVVKQLLYNGADPREMQHLGSQAFVTPFTAAVMVNSAPLFDIFIEIGADIYAGDLEEVSYVPTPLYIPVFAAARAMATHGLDMIRRCVDLGVDLGHRYPRIQTIRYWDQRHYKIPAHELVMLYLDSITSWKHPLKLRPVDGLAYLLKHNAKVECDPAYQALGSKWRVATPLEYLLDKWGLAKLTNPEFFATVAFLVEHGAEDNHVSRILDKYGSRWMGGQNPSPFAFTEEVGEAWSRFVDLLLQQREEYLTIDKLLKDYCRVRPQQLGRLEKRTVDCLLRAQKIERTGGKPNSLGPSLGRSERERSIVSGQRKLRRCRGIPWLRETASS